MKEINVLKKEGEYKSVYYTIYAYPQSVKHESNGVVYIDIKVDFKHLGISPFEQKVAVTTAYNSFGLVTIQNLQRLVQDRIDEYFYGKNYEVIVSLMYAGYTETEE